MTAGANAGPDRSAPHRDEHGRPSDSARQAWEGKTIPDPGFSGDTGAADPALIAAIEAYSASPSPENDRAVMAAVDTARWLVPIVALATETSTSEDGLVTDTRSDMAAVVLTSPEGSRALPVFTSLAALAEWDAAARPVPVTARNAAAAAISEECQVLIVDVASPHALVLRSSQLWALSQARAWVPAHEDDHVAAAVAAAVRDEPLVRSHRLEAGEPAGAGVLRVVLALADGLASDDLSALATRIGERIATDGETRARIDALTFSLERA